MRGKLLMGWPGLHLLCRVLLYYVRCMRCLMRLIKLRHTRRHSLLGMCKWLSKLRSLLFVTLALSNKLCTSLRTWP